ncbi:RluA family pseudouridine synthase [Candidatus Peregrinibacteria bacterium]|nr:MAG: RluA family pseudouridine synthase [Candidatus Peregrinibacteria bacterium]
MQKESKVPEPQLLYEDEHLLAFEKPATLAAVPADRIPEAKTLQGWVRLWALNAKKNFKPYPLHRLDRPTSGIMLFGKYPRDRAALEGIFKDPRTEKTYLALVKWIPKQNEGTIRIPLQARSVDKKVPAVTHYSVLRKMANVTLLSVRIETGRKHQIRQHLAMIGHPLVLDREYGDRNFDNQYQRKLKGKGRFFLHAWELRFFHPFTEVMTTLHASDPEFLSPSPEAYK